MQHEGKNLTALDATQIGFQPKILNNTKMSEYINNKNSVSSVADEEIRLRPTSGVAALCRDETP